MSTIAQKQAALYVILQSKAGEGQPLASCSDWPNPVPETFPHAYPVWLEATEDTLDTKDNENATQFIIRTLIPDKNDKTTYDTMLAVVDALLAELRKDDHYTLGGLCTRFHVSPSTKPYRTGEGDQALIVLDLTVTAYDLQDTTS